jgi:uncharacterized protein
MIVVVDTNIWISALHFSKPGGIPLRALNRAARVDTIAISKEIENEIAIVLEVRFQWSSEQIAKVMSEALARASRITLHGTVHLCRDPSDDKFLECAERAYADVIITGDKDLLALDSYKRTKIITPAEYLLLP